MIVRPAQCDALNAPGKIVLYFIAVFFLGAILAPPLFWGVVKSRPAAESHGWIHYELEKDGSREAKGVCSFLDADFAKISNRAILLAAVVLLWPLFRTLRIHSIAELGLEKNPHRWRDFAVGGGVSIAVMVVLALVLLKLGIYKMKDPVPWSGLLGIAALVVSIAAIPRNVSLTVGLLVLAMALVVVFLVVDRHSTARVLPRRAFEPGPLKWIYLTMGILMAATMGDMYAPLFGQRLGGLAPAAAGFLGAALSVGWVIAEIRSAAITDRRIAARVVAAAPLVMAAGLGLAALAQRDGAGPGLVAVWALALGISGMGIGAAWPHLSVWAMGSNGGGSNGGGSNGESEERRLRRLPSTPSS